MPNQSDGLVFSITAETAAAQHKLTEFFSGLSGKLESLGKMGEVFDGLGARLEAFLSVAAMVEFQRDAIAAGRSLAQLGAAMKSSGQASAAFRESLEQQRESLSKSTGVTEEEIVTAQRLLLSFGARQEQMQQLTGLTLDYAAAMGESAGGAAEQLGRALSGGNIMLRGMRVEIDQTLPRAQQFAVLMEVLNNRVGGQAHAAFQAVAPDVALFNLQLKQTELAMGNLFLHDVASPFLVGLGAGLARLEGQLKQFDATFPEVSSTIRSASGALGDFTGKIAPAVLGLGALLASIQVAKISFSALGTAIDLVKITTTSLISGSMLPILGVIAAVTTALYAGVEAWRAWSAASEAKSSARAAAGADEDLRSSIIGSIDSNTQSGAIGLDAAHSLEAQVNALDRAGLSADAYHKRLVQIATDLRHMVATKESGSGDSLQLALFDKKIAELDKSYGASSAAALSHGAIGAVALDDARNQAAYDRGLISLEDYLRKRRDFLNKQAVEEQIPIQKAIDVTTDELVKLRNQLGELESTSNYAEYTKVREELDKLKLQKEKLETDLLVSQQNATKRKIAQDSLEFQNPTTIGGGLALGLSDGLKGMGETAKNVATELSKTIGTAISSLSAGITGLIMGTKTWGQALSEVGKTILTQVVDAIVQIGVKWVLSHVIMSQASTAFSALSKALGWSSTADVIAQESAKAPALAVNASTASISSFGAASIAGIAALVAALGVGIAAAVGAFAEGGRPPLGKISLVGERGPELFVPDQAGMIIPSDLSMALMGTGMGIVSGSSSASAGSNVNNNHVTIGVLNDRSEIPNWARTAKGEAHVVDIVRRNIHMIQKG